MTALQHGTQEPSPLGAVCVTDRWAAELGRNHRPRRALHLNYLKFLRFYPKLACIDGAIPTLELTPIALPWLGQGDARILAQ